MERICFFQVHNLLKNVEKAFEKAIEKRIELALHETQHKMKADIVGFGKEFYRKYPKQWKKSKITGSRYSRRWK